MPPALPMLMACLAVTAGCALLVGGSTATRLDGIVAPMFDSNESGGVVLVARDERVLFRRAYGMADVGLGVAMRPDHVLGTGSITKQFTAAAILQQVAAGRLALDEDVRRTVPEFDTHGRVITIEQLLTHTAGLPDFVDREDFAALSRRPHTLPEVLALIRDMPLHFEPGEDFRYSNAGYLLLAAVLERVTGMRYADYMEQALFRPLGMRDTRVGDDARIIPRQARGYTVRDGLLVNADHLSMTLPLSAGAVFSTVDDLRRWDAAVRSGRVFPPVLLEAAWSPRTLPGGLNSGYGYGWKLCSFAGRRTVAHGGFVNGFLASLTRLRDDGILVAVLVNNDADAPDPGLVARRIIRFLVTGSTEIQPYALAPAERTALVGSYAIGADETLRIFERDGILYRQRNHSDALPLTALGPTQLTPAEADVGWTLEFNLGRDGRANSVWMSLGCEPRFSARRVTLGGQ